MKGGEARFPRTESRWGKLSALAARLVLLAVAVAGTIAFAAAMIYGFIP